MIYRKLSSFIIIAGLIELSTASFAAPPVKKQPPTPVDYNREVRPILAENCFSCHGLDSNRRQAGLRLDKQEGAYQKLTSGKTAIEPGKPSSSELVTRITTKSALIMPPVSTGKHLTIAQIALLAKWVVQGGQYAPHWAYIQPIRTPLPVLTKSAGLKPSIWNPSAWAKTPIDHFIADRLVKEGLRPSKPADRATLIRRVSFDLTGLPPTPAELDAFLNDKSPAAYEKQVDRLLASPHYGERMAMLWLDLVRYADTDGYHGDRNRNVYPYRDWVIKAFNQNMPFDEFTRKQIAGDLLPNPTLEDRVASGYHRLNMVTREGGAQPKEYIAKYMAERIRTTAIVWQGATLGCAECHDHKYDPFTAKDFYRFGAFFADIKQVGLYPNDKEELDPYIPVPDETQATTFSKYDTIITDLKRQLDAQHLELAESELKWEKEARYSLTPWTILHPESAVSKNGQTLSVLNDYSILASGTNPPGDTSTLTMKTKLKGISAIRLELLLDKSLPQNGPGRAGNGNLVITQIQVLANGKPVKLQNASATFSQALFGEGISTKSFSPDLAINGKVNDPTYGWAILEQVGKENQAVFETGSNIGDSEETTLTFIIDSHNPFHNPGHYRLSITNSPRQVTAKPNGLTPTLSNILLIDAAKRTPEQQNALIAYYRTIAPELQPLRKTLVETTKMRDDLDKQIVRYMVTVSVKPETTRVLPRGNWQNETGEIVTPGVPHFLKQVSLEAKPAPFVAPTASRLDLANWLISPDNPLTARVTVNRLWYLMFGAGIVRTTGDFGLQGSAPSHPELLDWLAMEFMQGEAGSKIADHNGWDIKHILKTIVLSNTYRQSSLATKATLERDPYNVLLARQNRFRLDAEVVRDNALAVSGLLTEKMGGRSVRPYQPDGYWELCNTFAGPLIYMQDHGDDLYRRGLYTYWKRTFLNPSLLAFDAPSREECVTDRARSNTPLQALVLMNDPTYLEAARALAQRTIKQVSPAERITAAYRLAMARKPTSSELEILTSLYRKHLAEYQADQKSAGQLLKAGEYPLPKEIVSDNDRSELAAWTSVMRVILNLNETITRE